MYVSPDASPTFTAASATCDVGQSSSLDGVSVEFTAPITCQFTMAQAAAGIAIPYDIVVAHDVSGVVPVPQDEGDCGQPGPSQLIVFEHLGAGSNSYCLCDVGLCPMTAAAPVTLKAGRYPSVFQWGGQVWNGPSDTGNPKGPAFPPGRYPLSIGAKGALPSGSWSVTATLSLTLTP